MFSLRTVNILFIVCILTCACSSPKKATPRRNLPAVTQEDVDRGGTSFDKPVVIIMETEREVLDEEYRWLSDNYPGYALGRRRHIIRSSRHYDIVRIKTRQGRLRDVYFDCTKYWGRK